MITIPRVQTDDRNVNQLQSNISVALFPILQNPQTQGSILENVALVNGSNTINHGLNRTLQGWSIVRQRASASIYDNQDNNTNPTKTLILISNAAVTVNLYVF